MGLSTRISVTAILGSERCAAFRPYLYLSTWVATIIVITHGDFASIPNELQDEAQGVFWVWGGLSLFSMPVAFLADFLIRKSPRCAYRALWLRLGGDIAQFMSILVYLILRFYIGDYHVYSTAITFAALGYVSYLLLLDVNRLIGVEVLASRLEKSRG